MPPRQPEQDIPYFPRHLMEHQTLLGAPLASTAILRLVNSETPTQQVAYEPIQWDDEDYEEPDFTPPAHTIEYLGLHTDKVRVDLQNKMIEDRVLLQIAAYGSEQIQKNGTESAQSDGWYSLQEATTESSASMLFNHNHHSFSSRYRIGYASLLERIHKETKSIAQTGHWEVDTSAESYHKSVIETAVNMLPQQYGRRVRFSSEGLLFANYKVDRLPVETFIQGLDERGLDYRVCRRPFNASFVLVNDLVSNIASADQEQADATVIQFPNSRVTQQAGNMVISALAGGA